MVANLLTLSIVVGISAGLFAGYAISRLFRAITKRLEEPTGFVFRLPGGILIFGVKTVEREPASSVRRLRLVSGGHAPELPDERLREAA